MSIRQKGLIIFIIGMIFIALNFTFYAVKPGPIPGEPINQFAVQVENVFKWINIIGNISIITGIGIMSIGIIKDLIVKRNKKSS